MRGKTITAVWVLIFMSSVAYAAFTYEADAYYRAAQSYMKSFDIKNALRSAYLAREAYEKSGSKSGVGRCDALLAEINSTLSINQMAEFYYDLAGDYYITATSTQCDIENLDRTLLMAEKAKELYRAIGGSVGSQGVLKADDLVKSASAKKLKCEQEQYMEAENFFNLAKSHFFIQEYLTARAFALNASEIYSGIPDPSGMGKTATLLSEIDKKISEIKINAAASYDKSLQLYAARRLEEALEYAASAQRLYNTIQYEDGYTQATNLLSRINTDLGRERDKQLNDARDYITDAETFFTIRDYFNATESAKKAKEIYKELAKKAAEEEKDLSASSRVKTMLYNSYIREVNKLLNDIQEAWGTVRMAETANLYYKKAQEKYLANRLNEALAYANNARTLCSDLRDYVCISKADTLIDQIKTRMQLRTQAEIFIRSARDFYNIAEFDNAYIEGSKAKAIYQEMLDFNKTGECQALLDDIQKGNDLKDKANEHYEKAENYYDITDYEKALEWARNANEIYREINDSIGIQESQIIITESEEYLQEEWYKLRNIIVGIVLVVAVAGIILFQYMHKQKKIDRELREKRIAIEERKRRLAEESALKVEKETKTRVEDELRRLIEEERGSALEREEKDV